eukprot:CAMPEP_0201477146 /NCGR_PEP_ID=MMETSP0151_2-20130828/2224_1 /ASSEMBLY_ACC=CAM_ASM_000257 /TAXON_ID=200890 /ORGANISM="Paramoeba atlantica, Strain 621/1 / CCAP 1560/9" /LENGTH=642 /DNA_ID=CAMNT_0047857771 /DNA_START=42 /DNA_END=1971 /DNA_ORIENTATION=-
MKFMNQSFNDFFLFLRHNLSNNLTELAFSTLGFEGLGLGTARSSLLLEELLAFLLTLRLPDVLHQMAFVSVLVTLGSEVKIVVQVTINLARFPILLQKTAQNTLATNPNNLGGKASITSTPALTNTGVAPLTLSFMETVHSRTRVDSLRLSDDITVLDQLPDILSGVGNRDIIDLIGVEPDLFLTTTQNRGGEPLLQSQANHRARTHQGKNKTAEMAAEKPTHWADIQEKAFTRWANNHLEERGLWVDNLKTDFCNGVNLINLIEIISHPKKFERWNRHPRIPIQKTENVNIALEFLKNEGIKLVNIGASDIVNGSIKLILGLIWTLILRYQINKGKDGDLNSAKNDLLEWVRSKIPEYDIKNFKSNWNDGKALCALNNALNPGSCPDHQSLSGSNVENLGKGMGLADDNFGIRPILTPEEMSNSRVDEKAVMAYISAFRDAQVLEQPDDSHKCHAHGPGLVEGVAGKPAPFTVEVPHNDSKLEVQVFGPDKSTEGVELSKDERGHYQCKYNPEKPGNYEVHVTFGGKHVPGSVFHVVVLPEVSLGGEGKIRVFYSTTSSSEKGRRDVFDLQRLLEQKGVHKRPNFEPWIPVDILTREDREAVFEKAGTRTLPIVYVDDKYVGDNDVIQSLEEQGKLDAVLG